jgi:ATP-binding cassette subfamily B protein
MPDNAQLRELLQSFPFLADQPPTILDRLAAVGQLLRFSMGQTICRADQSSDQLYFLIQGTARSVVLADRLPRRVATLERFESGSLLAWSKLSCGRCWETLIASTNLVVLAIPHVAMREAMAVHPPLGQRVEGSVNPSELFAVLDQYLITYPRLLGVEVVAASKQLADRCRAIAMTPAQVLATDYPEDRLWLVASGGLPLGAALPNNQQIEGEQQLRVLGIPSQELFALLDAELEVSAETVPAEPAATANLELLQRWQQQQKLRASEEPNQAPDLPPAHEEEPLDRDIRTPNSYPHWSGKGPLDVSVAAFRMLCDHLNLPFRREMLKRVFSDQVNRQQSVSLALAGAVAESIGLQTQLLETRADGLALMEAPLMIRWGNGLALIYRINRHEMVLGSPVAGNRLLSFKQFIAEWGEAGEVLTLRAVDHTPRRHFGFRWFLPALRQHRTVLVEVLLASFFVQLFGLVNPLLIQQVIDKVIINSSPNALGVLGLLLVVFAIFESLLLCLRTFLFIDTTNRIDLQLGTQIINHLLRLPLSYFDRRPVGEVSNRISELEKVRGFLTGTALTTILDAVFSVVYIAVMLLYSWQLTLLTLSVVPVLVLLTLVVSPIVRNQLQSRAVASGRTQSHLIEVLSSMITVKSQNIELRSRWKWQDLYTDYVAEGFDNTIVSTMANTFGAFLNKLSSLLVIWGGAALVLKGELSLGGLIAFRIISGYVTGPLLRMTSIWQNIQEVSLSLERLSDVIDTPEEAPEDNASRIPMPVIRGEISFRNICFRYKPSSPLLLRGINLDIPAGSFVAIVGGSGSGKSTLTKLLARLYSPEDGMVLVDGIDISKVELYSLRRQLGVVPQETVLFEGSVEDNITLTNPDATTEEIIEAARIAAAHDFIMALPAGYSTQVGERGSGISGGQRQRIAIARTILQRPRMLIMDEATSALDYQTERVVSENLMRSLRGCTVFFITHRLSSIVNADLIVCMGNGTVLEVGTHRQLMNAKGPYYVLFRQQGRSSTSSPLGSSSQGALPGAK